MAETLGFARTARGFPPRSTALAATGTANVLPALFLAFPAAFAAAATTLLAGGGLLGALAAYAGGGVVTLIAVAAALALPWRRVVRPARRWAAQGAAAPAQFIGR